MKNNENQPKLKKVYGFNGDATRYLVFQTKEEADRYNKIYHNGRLTVIDIDVYENMEKFEKDEPYECLERLCKEKAKVLYEIGDLPVFVNSGPKIYTRFTFSQLQGILSQANDKLKEKYSSPQNVKEDEIVKVKDGECEILLPVKDYMKLYEVYNNVCKRANAINAEISQVLAEGMIDSSEYIAIQRAAHIRPEHQLDDIPSYNFEMLENGPCYEKDYLSLE